MDLGFGASNLTSYDLVDIVSANLLVVPAIFACCISSLRFLFVIVLSVIVANIRVFVRVNKNREAIQNIVYAADSVCGVLITLICAYAMNMNRSCVGVFRIMWLVILVTSSTSYSFFRNLGQSSAVPKDVSLIALALSGLLLISTSIYARCTVQRGGGDDLTYASRRKIIAETVLVVGALSLRFEDDLIRFFEYPIGTICWHVSCACALVVCLSIVRTRERLYRQAD